MRLLTPDELAERWSVPKAQVYRLAREGQVPTVRLGRYVRFDPAAVADFEKNGGVRDNDSAAALRVSPPTQRSPPRPLARPGGMAHVPKEDP